MPFHSKNNTGKLFDNKQDRKSEKEPAYTGTALVNGKLMRVAMWHNPPTTKYPKATMNIVFEDYDEYRKQLEERREKRLQRANQNQRDER